MLCSCNASTVNLLLRELHPHLLRTCLHAGEGRVHQCLRDNFQKLTDSCRKEELKLNIIQSRDVRLRPKLNKACSEEIAVYCKDVEKGTTLSCHQAALHLCHDFKRCIRPSLRLGLAAESLFPALCVHKQLCKKGYAAGDFCKIALGPIHLAKACRTGCSGLSARARGQGPHVQVRARVVGAGC